MHAPPRSLGSLPSASSTSSFRLGMLIPGALILTNILPPCACAIEETESSDGVVE